MKGIGTFNFCSKRKIKMTRPPVMPIPAQVLTPIFFLGFAVDIDEVWLDRGFWGRCPSLWAQSKNRFKAIFFLLAVEGEEFRATSS